MLTPLPSPSRVPSLLPTTPEGASRGAELVTSDGRALPLVGAALRGEARGRHRAARARADVREPVRRDAARHLPHAAARRRRGERLRVRDRRAHDHGRVDQKRPRASGSSRRSPRATPPRCSSRSAPTSSRSRSATSRRARRSSRGSRSISGSRGCPRASGSCGSRP